MKKLLLSLLVLFLAINLCSANIRAVVVGVADYEDSGVTDLNYTDDDAREFYDFLIAQYPESSKNIMFIPEDEASSKNILKALSKTFKGSREDDINIFFFSGHGGKGFFVPYDYDGTYDSMLNYDDVRRIFSVSKAETKIIIGDACHAGSSKINPSSNEGIDQFEEYFDELKEDKKGIAVLMSSRFEEYSIETGYLENGVFTYFLMEGIGGQADFNDNDLIEIKELYAYIRKEIREFTDYKQTPIVFGQFADDMVIFDISNN